MILTSLKSGFAQVRANKRLVAVFYLANLFFGLLLMLPLRSALDRYISHSLMGAKLGGLLDMDFFFEFLKHTRPGSAAAGGLIFFVPVVYWLFTLFLSGGALALFASGERYSPTLFWGSAAQYFGRFVRLTASCLLVALILVGLYYLVLGLERLVLGSDPYQNVSYWKEWINLGLRAIFILLLALVLDYARIYVVLTEARSMPLSLRQGISFAFGNFLQTCGLALLLLLAGAVVLVIYNPIANSLAAPNVFIVFLLFVLQQIYMVIRTMLRLTTYASQLHLYRQLSAPAAVTSTSEQPTEGLLPAIE
jgi:hypothetical protein